MKPINRVAELQLHRGYRKENSTFSTLLIQNKMVCYTLENSLFLIPAGRYRFTRFLSPHNGDCFLLHDVTNRHMIEIHTANESSELKGCIAPCLRIEGVRGVFSRAAMKELISGLKGFDVFYITISEPTQVHTPLNV